MSVLDFDFWKFHYYELFIILWILVFLNFLSILIIPLIIIFMIKFIFARQFKRCLLLLIFNPISVFCIWGTLSYIMGKPHVHYSGKPTIYASNIKRDTRCIPVSDGCFSGNEWVRQIPINISVRTMVALFGPPWRSYCGPYPSKEDGLDFVQGGFQVPYTSFINGEILLDSESVILDKNMISDMVSISSGPYLSEDKSVENSIFIRAKLYDAECLIINILDKRLPESDGYLLYFDYEIRRPFAIYKLGESYLDVFPVRY